MNPNGFTREPALCGRTYHLLYVILMGAIPTRPRASSLLPKKGGDFVEMVD